MKHSIKVILKVNIETFIEFVSELREEISQYNTQSILKVDLLKFDHSLNSTENVLTKMKKWIIF